jgi:geranylgeranyl pyrophosphate synthase
MRINNLIGDVLQILERKSARAFTIARKRLLTSSIKNEHLRQALQYYEKNWNDVLHPGIIAIACEAVGGNERDSVLMQVPLLFISAAADIHDDILDRSQNKNGKPTLLGKFGEEIALLVGDRMLFKGMQALHTSGKKIACNKMDHIIDTIDNALVEVSEAHTLELEFRRNLNPNPNEYFRMIEKKSAILEAHTQIGALVGEGDKKEIESLRLYGRTLGTLMTLRDEFIDVFEPEELIDRLKNGCLPLPMIYAFKNPRAKKSIMSILSRPKISVKDANKVVNFVFEDQHVKHLKSEMNALSTRALEIIAAFERKQELQLLVRASLQNLREI